MDESSLLQSLGQVSVVEAAEIFRSHLRGCVREMICEVMATEVTQLCGPKHAPMGGEVFRAGTRSRRRDREAEKPEKPQSPPEKPHREAADREESARRICQTPKNLPDKNLPDTLHIRKNLPEICQTPYISERRFFVHKPCHSKDLWPIADSEKSRVSVIFLWNFPQ